VRDADYNAEILKRTEESTGFITIKVLQKTWNRIWQQESGYDGGRQTKAPVVYGALAELGIQNVVVKDYIFVIAEVIDA